jgi:glycosyltransferase involved in cell wall biosynthesis
VTASPIRVGIDYRPALLTGAGIGRSVRELSRALAASTEVELHLFGHSFGRARRSDPIPPGTHLHRLPIPGRSLPTLSRFGLEASRLCGRVSIFHWTDYIHPPVGKARTVLTVHDLAFAENPAFHGPQSDWLLSRCKVAATQASHIVCPTQATADDVATHLDFDPARTTVIPFGSDHVPSQPGPVPITEPYVLAVGTIEPRKNHRRLLAAWRSLPAPRPKLVVLGRRGWECDDIVADLERGVRDDGVIWHEGVDDATVYAYMAHARALVYPSQLEGFGFPPLEAMALGTPVLAGDTPALREVLGDAARFCDPMDEEDLATALGEMLADDASERRTRGRDHAAGYTWRASAEAHAALYREVLS